ncbi:hypothetical protein DU508_21630 [Pedobacter chinensis]|uniref:Uncharacterized protein n=1 Tax=Pedobacter chinensis TaxID=2282421 RepID=A0A369PSS1_9SPHI|nr:hypothetical protein [Pedobacter chinensis]RDC54325.1 hypothetical protein DU508_21630 [Pedobacter chinensis]
MNEQIKSLADEIREKLRANEPPEPEKNVKQSLEPDPGIQLPAAQVSDCSASTSTDQETLMPAAKKYTEGQVNKFFEQLEAFNYSGEQKSMIRVDAGTMKLLRRLKLVRGVEMNKVIVFALHRLLSKHSWLQTYIQDSLKNPDL